MSQQYSPQTAQALETFLKDLIIEKYGSEIDSEAIQTIFSDLMPRLERWIMLSTMQELAKISPEVLSEFKKLSEQGDSSATQEFIQSKIPNAQNFLAHTLIQFRKTYLGPSDNKPN